MAATAESMAEERNAAAFDALLQNIGPGAGYAPGGRRSCYAVVCRGLHRRGESAGRDIETLGHVIDVGLTAGPGRALRCGHGYSPADTAQEADPYRADEQ